MQSGQNLDNLKKYIRAANYLTVAQIFLQNNFLLETKLKSSDIKPRLLGHWGSCPGVNHTYAHLLNLARQNQDHSPLKTAFMLGPGHAFPALQANLFLENTLAQYDEDATRNGRGIEHISRLFSWPGGFPSHASPFTPGVILEGGELGYSLSTAFGAVLDNPNLVMATLIGDGEAETGAIASAWHLNKLIDPVKNGVVLPILHLNKYKISGPTIYGAMSDFELIQYFHGAGWEPRIVDEYTAQNFDDSLNDSLKDIYSQIEKIKNGKIHRSGENGNFVRLPMLIVRSKKGSSGPDSVNGEKIEGNSSAHQVPLPLAASDSDQLQQLEDWFKSYEFDELFDAICRLEIINITLNNEDNPQLIFESLNSTGLDLSEGDKIRNYILMGLPKQKQDEYYEKYWNCIEKCTKYDVSSFIRDYLSVKQLVIPSQKKVYINFKKYVEDSSLKIIEILEDLLSYAKRYNILLCDPFLLLLFGEYYIIKLNYIADKERF